MKDLIERLKKATGPDRELDAAIDAALRIGSAKLPEWAWTNFPVWRARKDGRVEVAHDDGTGGIHWAPLSYTASIDAALTLVPLEPRNEPSGTWDWQVESTNGGLTVSARIGPEETRAFAETPALALCIAALRARETLLTGG